MEYIQTTEVQTIAISACPICGAPHEIPLRVLKRTQQGIMHMMVRYTEGRKVGVLCPNTGRRFILEATIEYHSGQEVQRVQPE